jgi:hypothetical protein
MEGHTESAEVPHRYVINPTIPIGIGPGSCSLLAHCGYKSKDILVLTDRPGSTEDVRPTYINIVCDGCVSSSFGVHPINTIDGQGQTVSRQPDRGHQLFLRLCSASSLLVSQHFVR